MPLIKQDRVVPDDWQVVGDDEPLVERPLISLARWTAEQDTLRRRNGLLGLRLENDQSPEAVADALDQFQVITLHFPKFTDGRAYSQARILRERLGYSGELRATGEVLRDQYAFMRRCGFDAFAVDGDIVPVADWVEARNEITLHYQPDARPAGLQRRAS